MSKRAIYMIMAGGANATSTFAPVLISLEVSDKAGTHSDSARIELDDTGGRIMMPTKGAPVIVGLGWEGGGATPVFYGTVDEVRSSGSRGGGRTLSITAKGVDTNGKAKEGQQMHLDETTIGAALQQAAGYAGVSIQVDPTLASLKRKYIEMRDESFIHFGERIAREVGGNFSVRGPIAYLTAKNGAYTSAVTAAWGVNLHAWDIAPVLGRPQYSAARARWYDKKQAKWMEQEVSIGLDAQATHSRRDAKADMDEATQQANADKATSERDAGEGSVTIEGNVGAIPDGLCIVSGTRPGIDGAYRIEGVTHTYSRGSGFTTKLDLKQPMG